MKKIVVDCKLLTTSKGGIFQFFSSILDHLISLDKFEYILVAPKGDSFLEKYSDTKNVTIIYTSPYFNKGILGKIFHDYIYFPMTLARSGGEYLISPYYDFLVPIRFIQKSLITVHDLCYWDLPKTYPLFTRVYYKTLLFLNKNLASSIITVSESSKENIYQTLGLKTEKIKVVFNSYFKITGGGIDKKKLDKISSDNIVWGYTSGIDERKNIDLMLSVFNEFSKNKNIKLVITCGKRIEIIEEKISNFNLDRNSFILLDYLTDDEMNYLYSNKIDALVNLSLYEGFGRSNLEAVVNGIPLLASKIPVFEEVVGDYPVYVNQFDKKSILNGMKILYSKQKTKNHNIDDTRFSLDVNVKKFEKILSELVNG
jgi:glycosyltransferase involved in cell wall biosynthesis